jgi:hypothetical protein
MEHLHQQLDSIGMERAIISGLVLLGSSRHQRLQGGTTSACICMKCSMHVAFATQWLAMYKSFTLEVHANGPRKICFARKDLFAEFCSCSLSVRNSSRDFQHHFKSLEVQDISSQNIESLLSTTEGCEPSMMCRPSSGADG